MVRLADPAMLRTWGEVVQNATELWQALPVRPRGDTADGQLMTQLEAISQGMHAPGSGRAGPETGTRTMHTLYVGTHSVSVAVREHIRDLK